MFRQIIFCSLIACSMVTFADTKIVGGKVALEGAWPSTVSLIVREVAENIDNGRLVFSDTGEIIPAEQANYHAHSCGGSLITSTWVLTAAHCVVDGENGLVYGKDYYLALTGISDMLDSGLRTKIKRIVVHPDYNPLRDERSHDADIALLELEQPVQQSSLKLFTQHPSPGINTTVVGWGLTQEGGAKSRYLRQLELRTISNDQCKEAIRNYLLPENPNSPDVVEYVNETLTDNMFCTGDGLGGRDSCQADSGGPVMALANGEFVQLGVVSWGYGCAREGTYGVYAKVSNYFDWMKSVINPGSETTDPNNTPQAETDDDANGSENSSESDGAESSSGGGGGGSFTINMLAILGIFWVLGMRTGTLRRR